MRRLGTVLVRCDANVKQGTGHVMRCLALAQTWQDLGGIAIFAMAECPQPIAERLLQEGARLARIAVDAIGSEVDARETVLMARDLQVSWIVVDGYGFSPDYQQLIRKSGFRILLLDDTGGNDYRAADVVLNPNGYADSRLYSNRSTGTKLLLGSRFLLLRREFSEWRNWSRPFPAQATRFLVAMGGSDPDNVTLRIAAAFRRLERFPGLRVIVVLGGANPHRRSLSEYVASQLGNVQIEENVSRFAELMAWADAGLVSSGTTAWEACAMGLPVVVVPIVENQRNTAEFLLRAGAAVIVNLDFSPADLSNSVQGLLCSLEVRRQLSSRARALVDMDGARRVVAATFLS